LTKASLYVYFGPVAVLLCRRFDHTPYLATSLDVTGARKQWHIRCKPFQECTTRKETENS